MKVHEIMTAHARCVGPENTLVEAAGLMRELDVGALPVCEEDRLVGIVTDRDLALRGIANGKDPNTATIGEVMTAGVVHVFADQSVEEVARLMETRQIRRVPVLNRGKRLVGIVSLGDIAISSNPAFSGLALRDVSEPRMPTARQRRLAERSRPSQMMPRVPGAPAAPEAARGTTRRAASTSRKKSSRSRTTGRQTRKRASTTSKTSRKRTTSRARAAAAG